MVRPDERPLLVERLDAALALATAYDVPTERRVNEKMYEVAVFHLENLRKQILARWPPDLDKNLLSGFVMFVQTEFDDEEADLVKALWAFFDQLKDIIGP
jgi:hypothetical protein